MLQNNYGYGIAKGIAGGLVDLAPNSIVTRINGEANDGTLKPGMGVVVGSAAGDNVAVPTSSATAANFEGVVLAGQNETDAAGVTKIKSGQSLGILRWGIVRVRVKAGLTIAYGNPVFLIKSGANAGLFTNALVAGETGFAVAGRFLKPDGAGDVAPVEFFNSPQPAPAS